MSKKSSKSIVGIGIILNHVGEVLIAQRKKEGLLGGMWEFPGGKQEIGESIEETIVRELMEEVSVKVEVGHQLLNFDYAYSHKKLHFVVHICKMISGDPQPLESQQIKWVQPECLSNHPFPAANSRIISALDNYLKIGKIKEQTN